MSFADKRKKLNNLFFTYNMATWLYVLLVIGLVVLRMAIAYSQRVFLLPEGSGIDDMLMVRAAQSITSGNWLGEYNAFTLAKNMGFAFWLALLHSLHIPVLLANAALWVFACGFSVYALRPLFKGNIGRLVVLALLMFQPFSYAFFTQRVYRDAIFPSFSLLLFAGMVGLCLRFFMGKPKGIILVGIITGIGLAGAWLCREDGSLLLIFAVCVAIVLLVYFFTHKPKVGFTKKLVCLSLPFIILGVSILSVSAINKSYYGVFMLNDMTEGSFTAAYGAMVAVSKAESGETRFTPVTNEALEKMYEEVPLLAQLQPELESSTVKNGFGSQETNEFSGSFYFGLRYAASLGGYTPDARTAQEYWQTLQNQIKQAVEEGRLKSVKPSSTTVPKLTSNLVVPTARACGEYFLALFTFKGTYGPQSMHPIESIGPIEKVQEVADYLYSPYQSGYVAGTEELYYNNLQRISFAFCNILIWIYRVLMWVMLVFSLLHLWKSFARAFKGMKNNKANSIQVLTLSIVALGLFLSVLLRVFVCGYMEVAAFNVGVYLMYLSGAMPPLMLFFAVAIALPHFCTQPAENTEK